jgi:hypothetical protein
MLNSGVHSRHKRDELEDPVSPARVTRRHGIVVERPTG